ncbi:hypothetical protein L0244_32165 [bacterium]|nr:hypothetical protein [bacterium]
MPCCSQTNGFAGLGQLDPATLLALNSAFIHAKDLWDDIKAIFGIGAGAREADAIVPLQNELTTQIIAPVSDFLTGVNNGTITPSCSELQTWKTQVVNAEIKWLEFLHKTQWQDGRAAQQAEATLAPYWQNAKTDLQKYIQQKCGTLGGGIITTPTGELNWPVIAIGAGAIYMLSRRK